MIVLKYQRTTDILASIVFFCPHVDDKSSNCVRRYLSCRDLLSSDRGENKMEIKMNPEGGLHVPGLKSIEVHHVDDVNRVCSTSNLCN